MKALKGVNKPWQILVLVSMSSSLLSACGNIGGAGPLRAPESAYKQGQTRASSNGTDNSAYKCPDSPNIVPDDGTGGDGSGRFTVCPKRDSTYDVLIHGSTSQSDTICVFPTEVVDENHVYAKPDVQTGLPLAQCIQASDLGVYASFPLIRYNAFFIVEKPDVNQMKTCLMAGNYFACPHYSFGKFR